MTSDLHLTTALISAGSVVVGVIISRCMTLFEKWLEKRFHRQEILSQKYEKAADTLMEAAMVLETLQTTRQSAELLSQLHASMRHSNLFRIYCLLYFPKLSASSRRYLEAQGALLDFILSIYDREKPDSPIAQALIKDKRRFDELCKKLWEAKNQVIDDLTKNAKRYARI